MKHLQIHFVLFVLLLSFSNSHAQVECINLPDTIINCGFGLDVNPEFYPGFWIYECQDGPGFVSIADDGSGIFQLTFSECGEYELTYFVEECEEFKKVTFLIDDPSYTSTEVVGDSQLGYFDYSCHQDGQDCGNTVTIDGELPPDPEWNICYNLSCDFTHYTTIVGDPISPNSCLVDNITISAISGGDFSQACFLSDQEAFIEYDPNTGDIIQINFCSFVESIYGNAIQQSSCPLAPAGCFDIGTDCIDSIAYDTITYDFPVHDGGQWTMLEGNDTIILSDTTLINKYGKDLLFIIEPGADYYGPEDLTFTLLELVGGDTFPTAFNAEFTLWWQELWHYETIEEINEVYFYSDDPLCIACGGNSISTSKNIPGIPDYLCPPITISFGNPCECEAVSLEINGDPNINCYSSCTDLVAQVTIVDSVLSIASEVWTNENGDIVSNSSVLTTCNGGIYTYTVITAPNGCEYSSSFTVVEDFVPPFAFVDGPFILDCFNECVLINLNFEQNNQEVTGICTDPAGNVVSIFEELVACIPGEYTISLFNQLNGCEYEFTFIVEEILEPLDFTIQQPDVIACANCVTLSPNIDSLPFTPEFFWTSNVGWSSNEYYPTVCEPGVYTLTLIYGNCTNSQTVEVLESIDPITMTGSGTVCSGDCIEIFGTLYCNAGLYEYLGQCDTMYSVTIVEEQSDFIQIFESICEGDQVEVDGVIYDTPGVVFYTIDNGTLCPAMVELTIEVFDMDIDISGLFSLDCINSSSTVQAISTNPNPNYFWYNENGDVVGQTDVFTTGIPGTYTVESVNNDNSCTATNTFVIDDNSLMPEIEIMGTYSINCELFTQLFLQIDPLDVLIFTWSGPGISADQINMQNPVVTESGTYNVVAQNLFGCIATTEVTILQAQTLQIAAFSDKSCSNIDDGRIEVKSDGGVGPFKYKLGNEAWQESNIFENLAPDEYMISVLQADGCEDMTMAIVEAVHEIEPSFAVDQEYELCDTPELKFDLSQDVADHEDWKILWNDGSQDVKRNFTKAGNYSLEISNECEVREFSFFIADSRLQDELPIYIANVFSPNNDGLNDLFECHAAKLPSEFSIDIYDRWGAKVFESTDISHSWDGIVHKAGGKSDVYAYIANYTYLECDDRRKEFQIIGDVTIIR